MPPTAANASTRSRSLFLSTRQCVVDCEGMDPLLLMSLVVGEAPLRESTLFGEELLGYVGSVVGAGLDAEVTLEELTLEARADMLRSRVCPVRSIPARKLLGTGRVPKVVVRHAKKAGALAEFVERCEAEGVGHCCPSLVQIKYPSGARVHDVYSHPSEFLIACKAEIVDPNRTALVLMEVPNQLQLLHCLYIDWDMPMADFTFASEPGWWAANGCADPADERQRVEHVRRVAMGTPELVCALLVRAGVVSADDTVQVVVVEGTRPGKVGIHFVFKVLTTREGYRSIWRALLAEVEAEVGAEAFHEAIRRRDEHVVDSASARALGGMFSLVGMDLHPYQTAEQGLALPFSRKSPSDPLSRPMAIIHVRNGVETMWEVPCRTVWRAGFPIQGPHPDPTSGDCSPLAVLGSLLDASICIPGPRCIGSRLQQQSQPEAHATSFLDDEASRCSTATSPSLSSPARPRGIMARARAIALAAEPGAALRGGGILAAPTVARVNIDERRAGEEPRPASAARGGWAEAVPKWFLTMALAACPDVGSHVYCNPRYGSRPACARRGGVMFQINSCPMAICAHAACQVPLAGYRAHAHNGTLFYADGADVFASCMKAGCAQAMLLSRERHWHMARRLERLILEGDPEACDPERIADSHGVAGCLLDADIGALARAADALGGVQGRKRRRSQFEQGCRDQFHGRHPGHPSRGGAAEGGALPPPNRPGDGSVAGFVPVPPCRRKRDQGRAAGQRPVGGVCGGGMPCGCLSGEGEMVLASDYIGVPSRDRWVALDGKRTWVRVTPGLLEAHLAGVAGTAVMASQPAPL